MVEQSASAEKQRYNKKNTYLFLTMPLSMTYLIPPMVTLVSAMFVLITTFLVPGGVGAKTAICWMLG